MSALLPRQPDNVRIMLAERPWEELPALIAPAMRPGLKALADEMITAIRATVPAYARPLEGSVAEGVRVGEHHGSVPEVARAINVHPQAVRYRLNQLRNLFGDDLDDPDARFELMVVTRARTLRGRSWPG